MEADTIQKVTERSRSKTREIPKIHKSRGNFLILLLFVTTMLFSVSGAFAQDCDYSGTAEQLQWCLKDGTLTISGEGEMLDYDWGTAPWYEYYENINIVVIETGVATIGNFAFLQCTNLTSITISNTVTTIGSNAFFNCWNLYSINIPSNVTTIGEGAFGGCASLTSIDVESENSTYASENGVLFDKSKTTLILCPAGKTGAYVIPGSVTTIGEAAFNSCCYLISVTIPNSVTSIGNYAFVFCTNLTFITIPSSVTTIGNSAFYSCSSLTSIDVESENNIYASENGVLFDKGKATLICCPEGNIADTYVIPNSVITIEYEAFYSCKNLTSITISGGVATIGHDAFCRCTSLTSITIYSSVTTIEYWAFAHCSSLTSITNLNPVPVEIGSDVFYNVNQSECTLQVPIESVSAYQNAEVWKEFNIVGICSVNVSANNDEYGTATGGGMYLENETATVTAVAYSGYKFVNWTKNGAEVSTNNPYSFPVTEDVELVANFEEDVSIETIEVIAIKVYPNPAKTTIFIKSELPINKVEIYSLTGALLLSENNFKEEISVSALPQGVYMVRIYTDDGIVGSKFVKE
jgi:hypothetical protein